jgi:hypothetical protein
MEIERLKIAKESKEGVTTMCKAMEDMREKTARETARETEKKIKADTAKRMLNDGKLPLETIADYAGLPLEEVLQLKQA